MAQDEKLLSIERPKHAVGLNLFDGPGIIGAQYARFFPLNPNSTMLQLSGGFALGMTQNGGLFGSTSDYVFPLIPVSCTVLLGKRSVFFEGGLSAYLGEFSFLPCLTSGVRITPQQERKFGCRAFITYPFSAIQKGSIFNYSSIEKQGDKYAFIAFGVGLSYHF